MTITANVSSLLAADGWNVATFNDWGSATKTFATAVGPKDAIAVLHADSRTGQCLLRGEYTSEGRNVLESCAERFACDDELSASHAVGRFLRHAEIAVSQSYARGIFLRREAARTAG